MRDLPRADPVGSLLRPEALSRAHAAKHLSEGEREAVVGRCIAEAVRHQEQAGLEVVTDGPGCGLFGCSFDADLYLRRGAKATTTSHDCKSESSGSDESCSVSAPASDWWYVHVRSYSGGGSITLEATAN